ncbi:hypothetical protein XPA_010738 [Xanthoria parietina]
MTLCGTLCLFLSLFAPVFADGDDTVSVPDEFPTLRCDGGYCELNTAGTNFEPSAELLEKQIGPKVIIINTEEYSGDGFSIGPGVIAVRNADEAARLSDALLHRTATLDDTVYQKSETLFTQNILDAHDDAVIGLVNVERPSPDPDTRFASLEQDPMLGAIPTDLRSEIDPASLIPSPTDDCDESKCVKIIPSADVFYFGPDPTNTACLSAMTSPPPSPTLPKVDMDPSYVYVVHPGPQVFDECRNWKWGTENPQTVSYRPWELSTLEYRPGAPPATKIVDFADLPCPPTDVAEVFDPRAPYFPILILPISGDYGIIDEGRYVSKGSCEVAAVRDPPLRAFRVGQISGPNDDGDTIA